MSIPVFIILAVSIVILWRLTRPTVVSLNPFHIRVIDGDTIWYRTTSRQFTKIRIANIDAPEMNMPLGPSSKYELQELIRDSNEVRIISRGKRDRYKRTLAKVAVITKAGRKIDAGRYLQRRGLARPWN